MASADSFQQYLRQWSARASVEAVLQGGARNDVRVVESEVGATWPDRVVDRIQPSLGR